MKYFLSFIFIAIIFAGCAQKEQTVEINVSNDKNLNLGKPITEEKDLGTPIIEETIEGLESDEIKEDEVSVFEVAKQVDIAVVYPSKIVGRYAKSSMNTILGYLKYQKANYKIKVYDTINEDTVNIEKVFTKLREDGFYNVIALFSPRAMEAVHELDSSGLNVYLPLSSINDYEILNTNFVYGAISYDEQIKKLNSYSNIKNAMFYQESFLGRKLRDSYTGIVDDVYITKAIKKKRNNFKAIVEDERLNYTTLFLNTDVVKTSILLSQLRAYEIVPSVVLSTQINYNPKIISLTQEQDRTNFIVASSIGEVNEKLADTIKVYGGDVKYNWVDYSTLVGINYFYDFNVSNLIPSQVENFQVVYEPRLYISTRFGFLEIK